MFSVKINGFKSMLEAQTFLDWYEGQGEQDIDIWLECRIDEGKDIRDSLTIDCHKGYIIEDNTINAWIGE